MADGTPLIPRGMGITAAGDSPNAAQLLIDYVLTTEGQEAVCSASIVAHRDDVSDDVCGIYSVNAIIDEIGEDSVVVAPFSQELVDERDSLIDRWNTAAGRS